MTNPIKIDSNNETLSVWVHITAYENMESMSKVLECLRNQTLRPDLTRIVDNSKCPLNINTLGLKNSIKWNPTNLGTAGAINDSIRTALTHNVTYLWLLDQDSEPHKALLKQLVNLHQKITKDSSIRAGIVAPLTRNRNDTNVNHPMRWDRYKPKKVEIKESPFQAELIPAAGMLLHLPSIKSIKLPSDRYFLDVFDFAFGLSVYACGASMWIDPKIELSHQVGKKVLIKRRNREIQISKVSLERTQLAYRNITFLTMQHTRGFYRIRGLLHQGYRAIKRSAKNAMYPDEQPVKMILAPLIGYLKGIFSLGPTRNS